MSFETPVQENPMTEIALALAMGFFSLMVLTLISMETGHSQKTENINTLSLAVASNQPTKTNGSARTNAKDNQFFIIFDGKQFLDAKLNALDIEYINKIYAETSKRVILAMSPDLSIKEAMKARQKITATNLVVSNLNEGWLNALRSRP